MEGELGTLAGLVNFIQEQDTGRTRTLLQQQKADEPCMPDMKSGDICRRKADGRCHMLSQKESKEPEPWLRRSLCCTGTKPYLQSNSQQHNVKYRAAMPYLGLSWIWYCFRFSVMTWGMKDNMLIKSTGGTNL